MQNRLKKLMVLMLCLLAPCAWGQATSLRLMTEDYPPFTMLDRNEQVVGMSSEIVRELFRRVGIPNTIVLEPWIRSFNTAVLQNNTCVFSTTRSEGREHQFKWVGPLLTNSWVLYAGPASPKNIHELESVRRYMIGGYAGDAEAQFLVAQGFNVELTPADALNARKLAVGRIDFWATSKYRGAYISAQEKLPQLKPILVFNTVFLYLACNPGVPDSMIERLNTVLDGMQHEGFIDQVRKRYLGE